MTAKVSDDLQQHLIDFRMKHGLPMRHTPGVPPDADVRAWYRQLVEEVAEIGNAVFDDEADFALESSSGITTMSAAFEDLQEAIAISPIRIDLVGVAKECADVQYVAAQGGLLFGFENPTVLGAVCESNATKRPGKLVNGKVVKGEGYIAPDIRAILFPDPTLPTIAPSTTGTIFDKPVRSLWFCERGNWAEPHTDGPCHCLTLEPPSPSTDLGRLVPRAVDHDEFGYAVPAHTIQGWPVPATEQGK